MKEYQRYIADIITRGKVKSDRTGTGTVSAFGHFLRFNLREGFPLVTLKRTSFKSIKAEVLWFLEGSTDNERLHELGATIWDEWATEDGDLGPIYGAQWRNWQVPYQHEPRGLWERIKDAFTNTPAPRIGYDQIRHAMETLRHNPMSRRIVISGWNVEVLPIESVSPQQNVKLGKQALPPCHMTFILNAEPLTVEQRLELGVAEGKFPKIESARAGLNFFLRDSTEDTVDDLAHQWLDDYGIKRYYLNGLLQLRSSDAFLGFPYNVAGYALIIEMFAQCAGMLAGDLCVAVADGHIYLNHLEQAKLLLEREPKELCQLKLNPAITDIDDFTMEDIEIENYVAHPAISAKVAV